MKVTKAPQTHHFKHDYVSFSKDRKTKELEYSITVWKDNVQFMAETGKVKDEQHLKQLQGLQIYTEV